MHKRTSLMGRMFLLFGLLLLLPFAILMQIFRVNVVEGDGLRELWNAQAIDYISIPAQRGNIYDANGSILATNSVIYKIAVDPYSPGTTKDDLEQVSNVLSQHTQRGARYYLNRIQNAPSRSRYIVLERSITVQAYEDLRELDIPGVILEEDYRRNYNFGSLSAHVLGFVNHNIDGMAGLEAQYNTDLQGEEGLQQVRKDRSNRIFAYVGAPRKQPRQGLSLHTTIDTFIQAITEEELEAGIKKHRANKGTAIVMDPRTGAIKAMANYPTYNPNNPATIEAENRRNYAVADIIEPGSTFKLVTTIAAVEAGVVNFDEVFETPENGQKFIHGHAMRDHNPLGDLTFTEVISKSSNIATSEIAMRIEPDVFYQHARNTGFGTPTNIDLPGELGGRLQRPYEWSGVTLPWMSIGYEIQATPIQILQAYSAFANDGVMMRPYIVEKITDEFGNVKQKRKPNPIRRIAKKETIERLLPIFEEVVSDSGTAKWTSVDGLRIAGKTGTAQKFINGSYQSLYRASFAGFFPADNPKYAMVIILDEPKSSMYGGYTSGSIFREIAIRISGLDDEIRKNIPTRTYAVTDSVVVPNIKGFTPDKVQALLSESNISFSFVNEGTHVIDQQPGPGQKIPGNTRLKVALGVEETDSIPDEYAQIPDLKNMSMRQATSLLLSKGLNIEAIGSGTIYSQFPQAGKLMQKGNKVTVRGRAKSMRQVNQTLVSN